MYAISSAFIIVYREETGESSRLMEVGGSDEVGFYGYVSAFDELIQQVGSFGFIFHFTAISCTQDLGWVVA